MAGFTRNPGRNNRLTSQARNVVRDETNPHAHIRKLTGLSFRAKGPTSAGGGGGLSGDDGDSGGTNTPYYQTVQDAGVAVAQEPVLNIVGATVTEDPGKTTVTIEAPPTEDHAWLPVLLSDEAPADSFDLPAGALTNISWDWHAPSNYAGGALTIRLHFRWDTNTPTSRDIRLGCRAASWQPGDALSIIVYGAAVEVTLPDDGLAGFSYATHEFTITAAGSPAAGDALRIEIYRDGTHGDDSYAFGVDVLAISIDYPI